MMQKFIPEVKEGDKRIIIVNGEPIGSINRIPQGGDFRSNLAMGGKPEKTKLRKDVLAWYKQLIENHTDENGKLDPNAKGIQDIFNRYNRYHQ